MKTLTILIMLAGWNLHLYAQSTLFPVHNGDRWSLQGMDWLANPSLSRRVVKDTMMANRILYKQVLDSTAAYTRMQYYRQEGARIYQYGFIDSEREYVLFDFSRSPGDSIAVYVGHNDTTLILLASHQYTLLFGAMREQWTFFIDHNVHAQRDEELITITDSIGITGISGYWLDFQISAAYIDGRIFGSLTSAVPSGQNHPAVFTLQQNYPNPFNPSTEIRFSVGEQGRATLEVYTIPGQRVATLFNEVAEAERYYNVKFDARNLASGIYLYKLQSGTRSEVKKLMLLK